MGLVPEQWSHRTEYSRLQKVPCKLYSLALELTNNFIIWNGASPLRCYCFIWNFLSIYYLFINEDDLYSLDRNISLKIQICKIYIFCLSVGRLMITSSFGVWQEMTNSNFHRFFISLYDKIGIIQTIWGGYFWGQS